MNSKQRRKDRREWCYIVTIDSTHRDGDPPMRVWDRYVEMWRWCQTTWGLAGTVWREGHRRNTWQFTNNAAATMFALKWSR